MKHLFLKHLIADIVFSVMPVMIFATDHIVTSPDFQGAIRMFSDTGNTRPVKRGGFVFHFTPVQ